MGSRFVPTHLADQRAIELYLRLREIEKELPLVRAAIAKDRKKILIIERDQRDSFNDVSVERVISFDVQSAKRNGGTREALLLSARRERPRLGEAEMAEAVQEFLSGEHNDH